MIAISLGSDGRVNGQHFFPFDPVYGFGKTKEELEAEGYVLVENIPDPDPAQGYGGLFYSVEQGLYYKYRSIPKALEPEETQLAKMQRQIDTLTAKSAALATGQEMQEDVITEIVMHVYE